MISDINEKYENFDIYLNLISRPHILQGWMESFGKITKKKKLIQPWFLNFMQILSRGNRHVFWQCGRRVARVSCGKHEDFWAGGSVRRHLRVHGCRQEAGSRYAGHRIQEDHHSRISCSRFLKLLCRFYPDHVRAPPHRKNAVSLRHIARRWERAPCFRRAVFRW